MNFWVGRSMAFHVSSLLAIFLLANVVSSEELLGDLTWADNCGGNVSVQSAPKLTDCNVSSCVLSVGRTYTLTSPVWTPPQGSYQMDYTVTATHATLPVETLEKTTISASFPGNISYSSSKNHTLSDRLGNGTSTIQMEFRDRKTNSLYICQSFTVSLNPESNSTKPPACERPGDYLTTFKLYNYGDCCYNSTECVEGLTCRAPPSDASSEFVMACLCESGATWESSKVCKKIIGTTCTDDEECISDAECVVKSGSQEKDCRCKAGFKPTNDDSVCSGATSISNLSLSLQLLVALFSLSFIFSKQ